ncbi:MAG TPA: DUF1385 domain-containing protein [Acidimicrobiales bacterium]|nr:DUF1385 domain-containing protein [Acidimicrobiales bacterium]
MAVKVGGQALADGVLMRTDRAWAIARADGSVEVGSVAPVGRLGRVPGLRVLVGVFRALQLVFGRGLRRRRLDRRLLTVVLGLEAVLVAVGLLLPDLGAHGGVWAVAAPWALTLAVLRLATPRALWRYHGAEHKAVAAHEEGVDMDDTAAVLRCSRLHDRCGTNLVFLMLLFGLLFAGLPGAVQLPAFLGSLAVSAELVTVAASRPRARLSRLLLLGGRAVQRYVTTAEPTPAEQAVACRALAACRAEHHRLTAASVPLAAAA